MRQRGIARKRKENDGKAMPSHSPGRGGWVKNLGMLCDSMLSNLL